MSPHHTTSLTAKTMFKGAKLPLTNCHCALYWADANYNASVRTTAERLMMITVDGASAAAQSPAGSAMGS